MTGNPVTDQYAAIVRDKRIDRENDYVVAIADHFAKTIVSYLPDQDPRTIGEILLHAGAGLAGVVIGLANDEIPAEAILGMACNVLTISGGRLYSPQEEAPDA